MGKICIAQYNMETWAICTGVVWLGLPAAIGLNYHLALLESLLHGLYTWHVYETYKIYQDGEKTGCWSSCPLSTWGYMIYNGACISIGNCI